MISGAQSLRSEPPLNCRLLRYCRCVTCAVLAVLVSMASSTAADAASQRQLVVRMKSSASSAERAALLRSAQGARRVGPAYVFDLPAGVAGDRAAQRLRRSHAVAWTEPSRKVRAAFVPNDPGTIGGARAASGWQSVQWSLSAPFGINAAQAWSNAAASGGSGGRGVTIAVLDSGVSHAAAGQFRASRDLPRSRFVAGRDFVNEGKSGRDYFGHGTFVAHIIAASANNAYGTVGVAYRARIMPLKVLDSSGMGDDFVIAQAIRYAAQRGADVINLSLELFSRNGAPRSLTLSRNVREALRRARRLGVVVVTATGNSFSSSVPSRKYGSLAINVGGTTEHGCLGLYSNHGPGLDLVAPAGGADADLVGDPNCRVGEPPGRDIAGVGFRAGEPGRFASVSGFQGTSMAVPHVSGAAALVLASGILGEHARPADVERQLRWTARDLGAPGRDRYYGAGLLDAAAATTAPRAARQRRVTPSG